MRILHTSDWHLGQHFFTQSRLEEHRLFLDWLCEQVSEHQVDAVIVAGDVFDTGSPPSYARELYNQCVVRLHQLGCQLVVLAGNHDSVAVLRESKQLLAYLNTDVITTASDDIDSQIIELKNRQGETGAVLCAVPFLRPRDITTQVEGASSSERQKDLANAIGEHYQRLYSSAVAKRDSIDAELPIIGTGHLTALGVSQSESVRDIYIGTLEGFAANQFPPFDYLALGHIHRPQNVSKKANFRYSGSPIPLSFDETNTEKSVVLVDCANLCATELLPIPKFRPLINLQGDLQQIESLIEELPQADLTAWLSIEVQSNEQYSDIQAKIQSLLEPTDAVVLRIQRQAKSSQASDAPMDHALDELSPMDVFSKKLDSVLLDEQSDAEKERVQRITHQFEQILHEVETGNTSDAEEVQ